MTTLRRSLPFRRPTSWAPAACASAAAVLALGPLLAHAVQDEKPLPDRDLDKAGELLAAYAEAKAVNKGSYEAEEALTKELTKLGKKVGGDGESADAMLAHPASMARIAWLAADYDKAASKLKKNFGKITDQTYEFRDQKFEYSLWVPNKYAVKDGPYPVLITIPDEGEDPEEHIMEQWVEGEIRDRFIILAPKMPGKASDWEKEAFGIVFSSMRALQESYAVDFDRIIVGGRGLGVEAAHRVANAAPDRFAGLFGWAGDAAEGLPVENLRNVPVHFVSGGPRATAFVEAAKAAKIDTVTAAPEGKAPDIAAWAAKLRRVPYPETVSIVQSGGSPRRSHWLQVPPVQGDGMTIEGKVDRATNTITIESDGFGNADILLNDGVVDMDKPIKLIANGKETVFSERRSMAVSLDLYANGANDAGRWFVATRPVNIAKRPKPAEEGGDAGGSGEGAGTEGEQGGGTRALEHAAAPTDAR